MQTFLASSFGGIVAQIIGTVLAGVIAKAVLNYIDNKKEKAETSQRESTEPVGQPRPVIMSGGL
ncbi:MAG: hypothetical protein SWH61_01670 [Thermodesulfobacteriota bacterium]|nr:hypothetical protein [Thermodesulfobacteriota bacterium]